jgi:PAS domain S-box-containing protein
MESIVEQAARLRELLESAATAVLTIDANGAIETLNPATEKMFGYAAEELIG